MFQFLTRFSVVILATNILLPAQQTVWFTPLPYTADPDYLNLFNPTAPWQQAASHVQVFKIYGYLVSALPGVGLNSLSDSDLTNVMTNLSQRKIALAMEWPVLSSSTCGTGLEGFGGNLLPAVQRIKALGGTLAYLAMQQPFQWGSLYTGANSCQWTAQQVATNALVQINAAKAIFPNLLVGDISAVPPFQNQTSTWVSQYETWLDTWRSQTGAPLAFFHIDVDWNIRNWQAAVAAVRPAVEKRGIPFGLVYNGFLTDESDSAWMTAAESHFVEYEVTRGYPPPEHVIFQSWNANPIHDLPETDPTAFTYLIDRYFRAHTNLTLTNNGTQLSGMLTSGANGVAGASVQLTSQPISGPGTIATYTISGTVPMEARSAIVGARINSECYSCNGSSDVTVYTFQYSDTQGSTGHWIFNQALNGWSFGPGVAAFEFAPAPFSLGLHMTTQPGQALGLTSLTPVTVNPGAEFTFQVAARVSPLSVGTGYFTLIWLDGTGNEPSRESIMFEPQTQVLATATTAADGSFAAAIPVDPSAYQVTAQYAGTNGLWPSMTIVPQNAAPNSQPSIVSLTPNIASGTNVQFSVVFSDPSGWAAIANAEVLINSTLSTHAGCNISYLPAFGSFQLLNDSGVAWSNTVLSNSQCALSGASASGAGNNLTLTFTLSFSASFGSPIAQKTIFLQVTDSQGLIASWAAAGSLSLPSACTPGGTKTVTDVQSAINEALGATLADTDPNGDGVVNVVDVQIVINGLGCGSTSQAARVGSSTKTMAHPVRRRKNL